SLLGLWRHFMAQQDRRRGSDVSSQYVTKLQLMPSIAIGMKETDCYRLIPLFLQHLSKLSSFVTVERNDYASFSTDPFTDLINISLLNQCSWLSITQVVHLDAIATANKI